MTLPIKITHESAEARSADLIAHNIAHMQAIFPDAFTEGKIDFEVLKQFLGSAVDEHDEKFGLNWHGKRQARQLALTPSLGTLRPCPEESLDWATTKNLMIEGDNLEVMKLLQKSYAGKVKLIYIDPPYNTGKDFVYPDNYHDTLKNYLEITGQSENEVNLTKNMESNGRFHTDWLNMMYPRLICAREMLKNDGVILISIDDNEIHNLRELMDSIFGADCFAATIHVQMSAVQGQKVRAAKAGNIVKNAEYILVYSKSGNDSIGLKPLYDPSDYDNHYSFYLEEKNGEMKLLPLTEKLCTEDALFDRLSMRGLATKSTSKRKMSGKDISKAYSSMPEIKSWIDNNSDKIARIHDSIDITDSEIIENLKVKTIVRYNSENRSYLLTMQGGKVFQVILLSEKIRIADDFYVTHGVTTIRGDWWEGFYLDMGNIGKEGGVDFPSGKKPLRLIQQLIKFCTKDDDLILDFFAGSGTTGHAVMHQNHLDSQSRKFILVQIQERIDPKDKDQAWAIDFCTSLGFPPTISELTKERLRRSAASIRSRGEAKKNDLGFRVFKLDSSNIATWEPRRDDLAGSIQEHIDHLKSGRTPEDLLFEIILKYGIDLAAPITTAIIAGTAVHRIGNGLLTVCLSDGVTADRAEALGQGLLADLAAQGVDLAEARLVFKDHGFFDDIAKVNLMAILTQGGLKADRLRTL